MPKEVTATLENWEVDHLYSIVWGDIHHDVHKRWAGGTRIHTSHIKNLRNMKLKEGDVVTTLNSTYKLGKPQ